MTTDWIEAARDVAENVLLPNAIAVDAGTRPLRANLDVLAERGFYGLAADESIDFAQACAVNEILASGCVTTTLTAAQHHGTVMSLASGPAALRERWLGPLRAGTVRSGVAFTGAIPGPPKVTARAVDGGWLVTGRAPWVSGWGMVDLLNIAARDTDDSILWLLGDAVESDALRVRPNTMLGMSASNTVTVEFADLFVPAERLVNRVEQDAWATGEPPRKRINGSLALGVAARCCAFLDDAAWWAELAECRAGLDAMADIDSARARTSAFAVRAAAAAVVDAGSGAILGEHHAQRLLREAGVLLVFSSRPGIRKNLADRLATGG